MEDKEIEEAWSEPLNGSLEDFIFSKFKISLLSGLIKIEEFCIVYFIDSGKKVSEVVRYDWSEKESPHVHEFWLGQDSKRFINARKDFETIESISKNIKKNWREYRSRFINK